MVQCDYSAVVEVRELRCKGKNADQVVVQGGWNFELSQSRESPCLRNYRQTGLVCCHAQVPIFGLGAMWAIGTYPSIVLQTHSRTVTKQSEQY